MAVTVTSELIGATELEKDGETVARMVLRYLVRGLTSGSRENAFDALAASGIPATGDALSGHTNLRVVRHQIRTVSDGCPASMYVDVEYRGARDAAIYYPSIGFTNGFVFRGGTTLQSVETQLDRLGEQITVAHTFPASDPNYGGQTKTQGATLNVQEPQTVAYAEGLMAAAYPDLISRAWAKYVNSDTWASGPPGTWLCNSVTFDPEDASATPVIWRWTFEFQFAENGWQPTVAYNDPRDGRPPPGLVAGVGLKSVEWYPSRPFNVLFPV